MRPYGISDEAECGDDRKRSDRDWDVLSHMPFHTVSPPPTPSAGGKIPNRISFPAVISQELDERNTVIGEDVNELQYFKRSRTRAWESQILRDTCLNMRKCDNRKDRSLKYTTSPSPDHPQEKRW
eukprot:CAMPEP_0113525844 /NCGR_PEP_ID=MMETSP0015_2-20120614/404_1 /TAXON_ID=2838 /ORGANISM="Odontella" /LENGTH=124 /DNA_ID=CAMNT_0000424089 /DNA_START=174 /DNA_END=545 /DNA_ORIENTATION=+ /assembly_acc=CAM_ASM_000160